MYVNVQKNSGLMVLINEWGFSGISTFAHLPHTKCLTKPEEAFDIGIIGAPFDTAVSYRPGQLCAFFPWILLRSRRPSHHQGGVMQPDLIGANYLLEHVQKDH